MWPCDQSLVTLLFLWKKLSYPRFYMDLTWKINFFEVCSLFKFNNLVQALDLFLRFYTTFTKELKLIQKDFWANIYVYRNYWVKTGGRAFLTSPPSPPPFAMTKYNLSKAAFKKLHLIHSRMVSFEQLCYVNQESCWAIKITQF